MKWSDVKEGMTLNVKGKEWTVLAVDDGEVTLHNPTLGESVSSPPPDGDVEVVRSKAEPEKKPGVTLAQAAEQVAKHKVDNPRDRERLVKYAKAQGLPYSKVSGKTTNELRAMIADHHRDLVAEDNEVPSRVVMDAEVRLTLGATVIAELHEHSKRPQTPVVEVMDRQTMRNHFHFFHDFYPDSGATLERLVKIHEEEHDADREAVLHDHTVPF